MATLSPGGRIAAAVMAEEIEHLKTGWATPKADGDHDAVLASVLSEKTREQLDLFDRAQLAFVIQVCRESANDADRLRKYLARFDLDWQTLK